MATRQNHTQRHATIEDRLDALLDAEMARKARRSGCTDPRAYLRQQAAAKRREKRLAQQARRDAAWLVAQHVNTAAPPPVYHPGQNICRGYYPRVAKLVVIDPATAHAIAQCRALVAEMKTWKAAA